MALRAHKLVLLGGPKGSGKTVNAIELVRRKVLDRFFDTGEECRKKAKELAKVNPQVADLLANGKNLPTELVNPFVREGILGIWGANLVNGAVGYPRKPEQAFYFLAWLHECRQQFATTNDKLDVILIQLEAKIDVCKSRRNARAQLDGRPDDASQISLQNGVDEYRYQTMPALEILTSNGIARKMVSSETPYGVDTEEERQLSIAMVSDRIVAELKEFLES